jgi:thimet oligopeptidase
MRFLPAPLVAGLALAAQCLIPLPALAASTELPGPSFPRFDNADAVNAACHKGLHEAAQRVRRLERHAPDAGWSAASDDLEAYVEDVSSAIMFVVNVHPDPVVRDAAQACALKWQDFGSTLGQNEKLYQAARRVKPRDAVEREFLRSRLEGFEDSGVALPKDKRLRAKQIIDRLGALDQQFDKNLRDDATKVALSVDELAGVPQAVWKDKPRDDAGRVVLGLDEPTYLPVMERGDDAGAREAERRRRREPATAGRNGEAAQ